MRTLSLASGTLEEFGPLTVLQAAEAAEFDACGIWYDASTWSHRTTRELKQAFRSSAVVPLEIEVIILGNPADTDTHKRLLDAGADIGATEAIVVSSVAEPSQVADLLEPLCAHAHRMDINLCLEFLPIFAIKDLAGALEVLERVDRRNAKLLIDPLHLARAGSTPAALADLDEDLFSFAQFCDAPAELGQPATFDALFEEALHGRVNPGDGGLPLAELLERLPPSVPLSLEVRSRALREAFPDAVDRARNVHAATRAFLARADGHSSRGR
ncbi:MAG: sugar phosphate isomerase/epimerase [Gammaproteobacteria bacterium]|nr:sugar phosphate isomerase/epimerase [Gammaproteobacteria bacterium]